MPIVHLSPSTAQSYRKCGKRVYLEKVLGIPNPQQYAMTVYGSAMHHAIEMLYKNKLDEKQFIAEFSNKFQETCKDITNWKSDTEESLMVQGCIACKDFFANIYGKYKVELVEQEFNIDRGDDKFPILCFADAITEDKIVIDYKFGRGRSGTADSAGYALNMATYAWAYEQKYGELPKKVVIIKAKWKYKKDSKTGERVYYHDSFVIDEQDVYIDTVEFFKDIYENVEAGIKANVFLPAQDDDYLCPSCGYRIKGYCNKLV